jgi:CBS domain-containing protein
MTRLGVRQLPVLEPHTHKLVGILAASDVLRAQVRAEGDAATSSERSTLTPRELTATPSDREEAPTDDPGDQP